MIDCAVVGSGVIGATVARALSDIGMDVAHYDSKEKEAGSFASGGHMRPEWFKDCKGADNWEHAMQLLDDVWGVSEEKYEWYNKGEWKEKQTTIYRLDMDDVLVQNYIHSKLMKVEQIPGGSRITIKDNYGTQKVQCKLLVIAIGVWALDFFPRELKGMKRKRGISFRYKHRLGHSFVDAWAPYKQIVTHQQTPETIWIGDGTSVNAATWTQERSIACRHRCEGAIEGPRELIETRYGNRAYCPQKEKGQLFHHLEPWKGCHVATGAEKSGCISAGLLASRLVDDYS